MNLAIKILVVLITFSAQMVAEETTLEIKKYLLTNDPIDVVIPAVEKDLETLEMCIAGIKANGKNIRRIIVVANKPLTKNAEWFDEALFPFNKITIAHTLAKKNIVQLQTLLEPTSRVGWYYQQLLKLYAAFVIPDISQNILILDSDTIFLKKVKFQNENNAGLFNPDKQYHHPYFEHAAKLVPGLKKVYPIYSGISHHMLFQRAVLDDLFQDVEKHHQKPFWQAFCFCVSDRSLHGSGASEYEIYFNYVFTKTTQMEIRKLKWANIKSLKALSVFKSKDFDFVSCHAWSRKGKNKPKIHKKTYKDLNPSNALE